MFESVRIHCSKC